MNSGRVYIAVIFLLAFLLLASNLSPAGGLRGLLTTRYDEQTREVVTLDLFAMSKCQNCVAAESVIRDVMRPLGDSVRFRVFYVLGRDPQGNLFSPRGPDEIEEDIRQLCINEYFPGALLDYMSCLRPFYQEPANAWKACVTSSGADPDIIETCTSGSEGMALLTENLRKSEYLQISKSPILMINKRFYSGQGSPNALKDWICDELQTQPEACSLDLESAGMTGLVIGQDAWETCTA